MAANCQAGFPLSARLDSLLTHVSDLEQASREQAHDQRKLNGKGLPLAAVGSVVAGWPAAWLSTQAATTVNWWGWALLAVGVVFGVVGVRWLRDAWPEVIEGWHEARPTRLT